MGRSGDGVPEAMHMLNLHLGPSQHPPERGQMGFLSPGGLQLHGLHVCQLEHGSWGEGGWVGGAGRGW